MEEKECYGVLTSTQSKYKRIRQNREFYIHCRAESIFLEIDNASCFRELEQLAKKYDICDTCDFSIIHLKVMKKLLKVIVRVLYEFPKLRSKLCYLGTVLGYQKILNDILNGKKTALEKMDVLNILDMEVAKIIAEHLLNELKKSINMSQNVVALAVRNECILDGILIDSNDFDEKAYNVALSTRKDAGAEMGIERVIYHEIGHCIDDICKFSSSKELKNYLDTLTRRQIERAISNYALTSIRETVAEAFAECMSNKKADIIARKIGNMLKEAYSKLR